MKRKLSLLTLGSTLFLFASVAAVFSFDLYTVPENLPSIPVRTMPSGVKRIDMDIYANSNGNALLSSPVYDPASDAYNVPAYSSTSVDAPSPDAVAYGDVTEQSQTIGKPVVVSVPGTDILKLADGTYTNYTPSDTLNAAYKSLPPSIPYSDPASLIGTTHTAYWSTPYTTYPCYQELTTPTHVTLNSVHDSLVACGSDAIPETHSCLPAIVFVAGYYSSVVNQGLGALGCSSTSNGYLITRFNTTTTTDPDTEFTPDVTPSDLAAALSPSQADFANNGLAGDYLNACAAGASCSVVEGDIPQDDIDNWLSANDATVNNIISGTISDGAAAAVADGTNTGAQQQQAGQLAGILSALNKLNNTADDIEDNMNEGYELTGSTDLPSDNTYDSSITQPVENSLSDKISSYITSGLPLTQFLNNSGFTVSGADPRLSCDLWGSTIDFDISPMESTLHWMGLIVFAVSTISAFMIVIKR